MALRNLHSIVNRYTAGAVSPNFIGSWLASHGYTNLGDARFTGSVAGDLLTVSAIASGALAIGSLLTDEAFTLAPATVVTGLGSGAGGVGTYIVNPAQAVASEAMTATGQGARTSGYTTFANVPMQVQAVSGDDLKLVSALNIQGTLRAVWMNGQVQGVQRPNVQGGDILQIPTGLTTASGASFDTWLVVHCPENWDIDGWCHVIVQLQMATQSQ
jgi:hypothetical protein